MVCTGFLSGSPNHISHKPPKETTSDPLMCPPNHRTKIETGTRTNSRAFPNNGVCNGFLPDSHKHPLQNPPHQTTSDPCKKHRTKTRSFPGLEGLQWFPLRLSQASPPEPSQGNHFRPIKPSKNERRESTIQKLQDPNPQNQNSKIQNQISEIQNSRSKFQNPILTAIPWSGWSALVSSQVLPIISPINLPRKPLQTS